ncbi:MAG: hypothetical protein M1511_03010 [Deltaproteobacteria bacterium]|nr:hypothetical protein [Deltaproteobacteria bacterium]
MGIKEASQELKQRKARAREMGGTEKIATKKVQGTGTVRDRIEKLLDPGSFFEIGLLNHSDVPGLEDKTPACPWTGRQDTR